VRREGERELRIGNFEYRIKRVELEEQRGKLDKR
jgi:hypothetical protein